MEVGRTEEELVAMLADFGTQDPEIAKRTLNFIPLGLEGVLSELDELSAALGYYAQDIALFLDYFRMNQLGVEGRGRDDLLLGISQKASSRVYRRTPSLREAEEEEKK